MRIAHIVSTYPPYYGGMGNVVFQTASELVKFGYEVEVITPGIYEKKEIKKIDVQPEQNHADDLQKKIDFATRLKPSLRYGNAARLPTIKKELDRFDLVHLHYPFFGTANLVRKWKLKNPSKPLVITYHMDPRGYGWLGLVFKFYARFWMPKILSVADKIIVSSVDYAESSEAFLHYQKNKDKWVELPFGVDTERFSVKKKPEHLFLNLGLSVDKFTILFVGGMDVAHHFKGVGVLLQSIFKLKQRDVFVQVVLVGDGELRVSFELQAKNYGIEDRVRFVGYVADEDLPSFYNLADVFVLPSVHQGEAFGMVLLEAMASGVPVVASDLAGVRTVAKNGGLTFAPGSSVGLADVLQGFFSAETDREFWHKKARLAAENIYSWPKIVGELDKLYQNLV